MKGSRFFSRTNIKGLDHYVLINYPLVWMTKAHYFLVGSIIFGNILAVCLGLLYPMSLHKLVVNWDKLVVIGDLERFALFLEHELNIVNLAILIIIILCSILWGSYLNRSSPRIHSVVKFGLFFLCFSSLAVNFLVFESILCYRIASLETDENMDRVEQLFYPVYECDSITFLEKYNRAYSMEDGKELRQIPECEKKTKMTSAFFMQNKDELEIFLAYMKKYQFAEIILGHRFYKNPYKGTTGDYTKANDFNLVKGILMGEDTTVNRQFLPIIFEDDVFNYKGALPIQFLRHAQKGPFYLLNSVHQILLGLIVFFIPIMVYWFSQYTILETMITLFSNAAILLILSLSYGGWLDLGWVGLKIIAFLYLMRLILFDRVAIRAFYANIGWSVLLVFGVLLLGLVGLIGLKSAVPLAWQIASSIILYLILSFLYILILFQNRASFPRKI